MTGGLSETCLHFMSQVSEVLHVCVQEKFKSAPPAASDWGADFLKNKIAAAQVLQLEDTSNESADKQSCITLLSSRSLW